MRASGRCSTLAAAGLFLATGCEYAISGQVTGAIGDGVVITLGGYDSGTATTAGDGRYAFSRVGNGSYTVTPSLSGYTFDPRSVTVSVDGGDVTANFVAKALPGVLDARFGTGGAVTTSFGGFDVAFAVAVQPDGRIVAAGRSDGDTIVFALARYQAEGSLDPSFGVGGKVTTAIGSFWDEAHGVALQGDGKIVAVGTSNSTSGSFMTSAFAVARYDADGGLDATFGSGGQATTTVAGGDSLACAVAIQPDGKILVAGQSFTGIGATARGTFALARFNPDGSLDGGFGTGGTVSTAIGASAGISAVALQADGKIVAAGWTRTISNTDPAGTFALARYNPDGSLDAGFGSGGVVTTPFSGADEAVAVAVQADEKIVAAGVARGYPISLTNRHLFALARYAPDGSLDATFGAYGKLTTGFWNDDVAQSVAIQADGKIVAAGATAGTIEGRDESAFALARYLNSGSLDPDFGARGQVYTVVSHWSQARAVAIQPDGKIVAAGNDGNISFALMRYWP